MVAVEILLCKNSKVVIVIIVIAKTVRICKNVFSLIERTLARV